VSYRSFLERLSLSAATINLHLSAIRRLADERKMGNWLTRNQAQELVNAASKNSRRGWREGATLGLLSDADSDARKSWI
jgi:hypothetical protein